MKLRHLAWLGLLGLGSAWGGSPQRGELCAATPDAMRKRIEQVVQLIRPQLATDEVQIELSAIGETPALFDIQARPLSTGLRSRLAVEVQGVSCSNRRMAKATVWFKVRAMREVWVYGRNGRPGSPLADAAPRRERVDVAALQVPLEELPGEVDGLWLIQAANAGMPVLKRHLQPEPLVRRDMPVTVVVHGPGLMLRTQGRVMRAGALGDSVPVLVEGAESSLVAIVAGKGEVHVEK